MQGGDTLQLNLIDSPVLGGDMGELGHAIQQIWMNLCIDVVAVNEERVKPVLW